MGGSRDPCCPQGRPSAGGWGARARHGPSRGAGAEPPQHPAQGAGCRGVRGRGRLCGGLRGQGAQPPLPTPPLLPCPPGSPSLEPCKVGLWEMACSWEVLLKVPGVCAVEGSHGMGGWGSQSPSCCLQHLPEASPRRRTHCRVLQQGARVWGFLHRPWGQAGGAVWDAGLPSASVSCAPVPDPFRRSRQWLCSRSLASTVPSSPRSAATARHPQGSAASTGLLGRGVLGCAAQQQGPVGGGRFRG